MGRKCLLGSDKALNGAMPCLAHKTLTKSNCLFDEKYNLPLTDISPDGEGL